MPSRYPSYTPPPLTLKVWLRDPGAKPDSVDPFVVDPSEAEWQRRGGGSSGRQLLAAWQAAVGGPRDSESRVAIGFPASASIVAQLGAGDGITIKDGTNTILYEVLSVQDLGEGLTPRYEVYVQRRMSTPAGATTYDHDNVESVGLRAQLQAESWGRIVWAAKRDIRAQFQSDDAVPVYETRTAFTIRERSDVAANAEVVYGGKIYQAEGEPLLRGGPTGSRLSRYFEVMTKLRQ